MRIIFFLFITLCCACTSSSAQSDKLSIEAAEKMIRENPGIQILDVRTPAEFAAGHLEGAVNYNINAPEFADNLAKLDKEKDVVVYCAAGGRSAKASGQMNTLGFKKVHDMSGGMNAWRAAGKKTVQ
jgi:rhodanese-related sulfurtransferase